MSKDQKVQELQGKLKRLELDLLDLEHLPSLQRPLTFTEALKLREVEIPNGKAPLPKIEIICVKCHETFLHHYHSARVRCGDCIQAAREERYEKQKEKAEIRSVNYVGRLNGRIKRQEKLEKLGGKCACCGSFQKLEFDHIIPGRPELQILCKLCNRLKLFGPKCPCQWWDSIDPSWRERYERRKGI